METCTDGTIKYCLWSKKHVRMLPLWVPGLEVVRFDSEHAWFTWSREAMWERYRALVEEFGVADPRLAYRKCRGVIEGPVQMDLPGSPRKIAALCDKAGFFTASWTPYGLSLWDQGFCERIREPDKGGPNAIPFDHRVEHSGEWWLMGSRGDQAEVLELEILSSPLDQRCKDNLTPASLTAWQRLWPP